MKVPCDEKLSVIAWHREIVPFIAGVHPVIDDAIQTFCLGLVQEGKSINSFLIELFSKKFIFD